MRPWGTQHFPTFFTCRRQKICSGWCVQPSETYESQLGLLFPIYGNIKNVPNHQSVLCCSFQICPRHFKICFDMLNILPFEQNRCMCLATYPPSWRNCMLGSPPCFILRTRLGRQGCVLGKLSTYFVMMVQGQIPSYNWGDHSNMYHQHFGVLRSAMD